MGRHLFEEKIIESMNHQSWLDDLAKPIQAAVGEIFRRLGGFGTIVTNFLHGSWLGHPLHPIITDVTVGAYTTAVMLDVLDNANEKSITGKSADAALSLGIVSSLGAAASGLADWQYASGQTRRYGLLHAMLNSSALISYIFSLMFRLRGKRDTGKSISLLGYVFTVAAAYLGGDMVFRQKMGINNAPTERKPREYIDALAEADLLEGGMKKVIVKDIPVLLIRQNNKIFAIAETCAHMGGSLSKGDLLPDGTVVCPLHQSIFEISSGKVIKGPSAYSQPCYQVRVNNGQIQIRHSAGI